jgi:pilus assembly protein FimV
VAAAGVVAAGAAGAAALYAANQAEADEHLHSTTDETPVDPAAVDASAPGEWDAEQEPLTDKAQADGLGAPLADNAQEAIHTAPETLVSEPLITEAAGAVQPASEPEIDWDAAFAEQAGEAHAAHGEPADTTLSSLEALGAAAAVGGAAAAASDQTADEPHASAPESGAAAGTIAAEATPDGGVAGMLGDLDLSIPGQPAHVGTISSDALPSLTQGLGSVQFKMAPLGSPEHEEAAGEPDAADVHDELSDADFDAAMAQAASEASRGSYTDRAHEAPSLKPMSFDLSDFSLDLKGDDTSAAPASVSEPVSPAGTDEEALVSHGTLASPEPDSPYAAAPAAPQTQDAAPAATFASVEPIVPHAAAPAAAAPTELEVPNEFHTKLELAMAYQTIGDDDGARELLEEVIAGGDAAQQSLARTRLAELGK